MNLDDVIQYLENWLKSDVGIAVMANLERLNSRFLVVPFANGEGLYYYTSYELSGQGLTKSAWRENELVIRLDTNAEAVVHARRLVMQTEDYGALQNHFEQLLDWAGVCLSGTGPATEDEERVQLHSLASSLDAWRVAERGQQFFKGQGKRVTLLETREGGYVRTFELGADSCVSDFYPVSRPSSRGSEALEISVRALVLGMRKFGSFGSITALEGLLWTKLGLLAEAA